MTEDLRSLLTANYGFAEGDGKKVSHILKTYPPEEIYSGLKEFLAVKKLETTRNHLPRSDHIEKILSILSKVKHVEEGRGNILLSDFKINLQELSLNGIVGNLKALYLAPGGSGFSVLDEFNQLEFLSDIAVRNYERNEDTR